LLATLSAGETIMNDKLGTALALVAFCGALASEGHPDHVKAQSSATQIRALKPPANGVINVAVLISEGTVVIDFAGPWEVFQETMFTSKGQPWTGGDDMIMPFNLYTVSDSEKPVSASGLMIVPNYTFENAPKPQVIVIPAQAGRGEAQKKWLLENSKTADLTMSVCTGASMLAAYGFLDHQKATTHHMSLEALQKKYPNVEFVSGTRFVDNDKVATAGGLSSGIDLALHVVERYYGRAMAQATADYMEYKGELWKNPQYGEVKAVAAKN
jgi:transcriptional regulator GlxA family with amidase domain